MERSRAWPAPPSAFGARTAQICAQPGRHRRSCRRTAVLVRHPVAGGFPFRAGVPHGALLQDRALFAGHALAARCVVSRAPRAVRLTRHHAWHLAGCGRLDASGEGKVQPDKLGTIPDALWWSIVTVGTIGYGDVVPVTAVGKLIAAATIFLGLILMALPIGIIATAFSEQIHRRDFIVTWGMIARVPLFAELDAGEIADIMQLLRAQLAESGEVIVRQGDHAHSMYFIAAGEVEVALKK
ncbi:MAG: hypothetical protein EXR03_10485, partial [Pseudolabrys sp.]|nr:hypothetical protein [Pseudolabrys sp.]